MSEASERVWAAEKSTASYASLETSVAGVATTLAKRDDENFCYAAAWEYTGDYGKPTLNKEPLSFEEVHLAVRSYK